MKFLPPWPGAVSAFFKPFPVILAALALGLGACAPLAKVTVHEPVWSPSTTGPGGGPLLAKTKNIGKSECDGILTNCLDSAESAFAKLKENPDNTAARREYEYAVSRMFSAFRKADVFPSPQPLSAGGRTLEFQPDARKLWNPADYDFFPVDELQLGGSVFQKPVRRAGLGAPLVAIRKTPLKDFRKIYLGSANVYYGVTGVVRFEGKRCVISLLDPLADETVKAGGKTFPLAADFTTALAMLVERDRPDKMGLVRLLRPRDYEHTTMLYRLQPFDPKRIPVVFVHGLDSTPATWLPMFTTLLADEEIRRKYQFWFFSYPSGYPFAYSASLLRRELDGIAKVYPHKPVVMVGHSMGGLLTRLMITRSGSDLWRAIFRHPPEKTMLLPGAKKLFEDSLIFEPRREVSRAVFFSAPHRGSEMAAGWMGRLGSRLVRLPRNLVEAGTGALSGNVLAENSMRLSKIPNSVDTLSPKAPFTVAMNRLPLEPGVPWHQIIGDRGRGDSPNSSDGFVAYWSSHIEGKGSTLIVPSGHSSHTSPAGIEEMRRILHEHLKATRTRRP